MTSKGAALVQSVAQALSWAINDPAGHTSWNTSVCQTPTLSLKKRRGAEETRQAATVFDSSAIPPISIDKYLTRLSATFRCSDAMFIAALILVDRLLEYDGGRLPLTMRNVHRIFFASLVVAVKYHEDLVYSNNHYAKAGGVHLREVNRLERVLLAALDFDLRVEPEQYRLYEGALLALSTGSPPTTGDKGAGALQNKPAVQAAATSESVPNAAPATTTAAAPGITEAAPAPTVAAPAPNNSGDAQAPVPTSGDNGNSNTSPPADDQKQKGAEPQLQLQQQQPQQPQIQHQHQQPLVELASRPHCSGGVVRPPPLGSNGRQHRVSGGGCAELLKVRDLGSLHVPRTGSADRMLAKTGAVGPWVPQPQHAILGLDVAAAMVVAAAGLEKVEPVVPPT
mmetsp:Transcript_13691/g.28611  ORF Transcript_13691/g.28611 Transcript_13691/m.28611 type:complete len:396 (-) Transcript_13691:36-1223(-)